MAVDHDSGVDTSISTSHDMTLPSTVHDESEAEEELMSEVVEWTMTNMTKNLDS
jgi:hypothetical protein